MDRPQGEDWWQFTDGRWYPPKKPPGRARGCFLVLAWIGGVFFTAIGALGLRAALEGSSQLESALATPMLLIGVPLLIGAVVSTVRMRRENRP